MSEFRFVLYLIKTEKEEDFRKALSKRTRDARMIITLHPATSAPANLRANGTTDSVVFIRTKRTLTVNQVHNLFDSVQAAVKKLGGSMCPIMDQFKVV